MKLFSSLQYPINKLGERPAKGRQGRHPQAKKITNLKPQNSAPKKKQGISGNNDGPGDLVLVDPNRGELSESQIRAKFTAYKDAKLQKKKKLAKPPVSTPKGSAGGIEEKSAQKPKDANSVGVSVRSEVGANDPNKEETKGKLLQALTTSSFGFSEKEKSVLGKILKGQKD